MTLSDISIRNPVFAWMLMLGLILFGAVSYSRLGISQLPDVDFPVLNLSVAWPGAAPDVIEAEIVDPLEQAVVSVEGITDLNSSIREGSATISLEFDLNRNIDAALQEVQAAISRVRLPLDVDPPTIRKQNPEDQPIMWMAISSKTMSLRELITFVELRIKDQFQILPGVGEVQLGGYTERNLRIWVNNENLAKYELTILDIRDALQRGHIETAAGTLENDRQQLNLRFMGEGLKPEDVGNILITSRGGRPIYNSEIRLKDVIRVEDGLADIGRISRSDGTPSIGIGIRKQRGANAVEVGENVRKRMQEISQGLKEDMRIEIVFDTSIFVKEAVDESEFTLVLSALVTAFVCFLFLGSLRPTFNILLSIPTSIIGTFTFMYFFGFTLNLFTILALALAIGIVVDDAIMVLENIYRHKALGKSRVNAAKEGANEITFAATAATIAVIAIFLPIAFMKGVIGKFFFQFGVTITAAVFLSLIEAITLTPMRCSEMMEEQYNESTLARILGGLFGRISSIYRKMLAICLRARFLVIIISLVLFCVSLKFFSLLRKEFIPPQDQGTFIARMETPVGSSIEFTSQAVKKVEDFLKQHNEIVHTFISIGGFGGGEGNSATTFVTLKPRSQRKLSQDEIMQIIRKQFSGDKNLKVVLQDLSTRGLTARRGFPVDINIRGPEWDVLNEKSQEIIKKLEDTGLVMDTDTDYRLGQPEVRVWPLRETAAQLGVTMESISSTVEAAMGGVRQGKFTKDGRRYDVRVRMEGQERLSPEDILNLSVRNIHGELVPMKNVVRIEETKTLQTITRKNRERSISIYANVAPGKSQSEALSKAQEIAKQSMPPGYRVFLGGGAQTFIESFDSLVFVLWLGILVAYMVLASQFNSFIHPLIVFLSMPFSLSGALMGLYFFNQSLNLYSMIGIILLMGIVKKNAILLVEFTNHKRFVEGLGVKEAILEASPIRLRPILMTSFATLAAALPPALALGPGAETRVPMAITILGGVLVSTFFTLFVTPCTYSLMAKLERK
jgi:hydrophobe/amphiphile efflux-1 (HAE1) family protein